MTAQIEFPAPVVARTSVNPNGVRYLFIGDDSQYLVVLGHHAADVVQTVVEAEGYDYYPDDVTTTWVGPQFVPGESDFRLDWRTPDGKGPDHFRNSSGYFPAVVVDLEG